ncbi:IclR family transcriptional regulator [Mycobacterium dioxanotrophicus]
MAVAGGSLGLSELADRTNLPPPTVHRLVRSLVSRGYARQLPGRGYALGPKLIHLGESATKMIGAWAAPHLSDLVIGTGETANMAVLDGAMAVYVAQVPSPHAMRMFTEVGRRVHLHCTGVGKALLLQLPDDTVRQLVGRVGMPAYTPNSHTDIDSLLADLAESRRRGYALDEGEQEVGVRCFSVPVPDAPTPTALSISGPAARLSIESADHNAPLLQRVAKDLSAEFGKGTVGG